MGSLTKKYEAWAKYPSGYSAEEVLSEIVSDLKRLDEESPKSFTEGSTKNIEYYAREYVKMIGKATNYKDSDIHLLEAFKAGVKHVTKP